MPNDGCLGRLAHKFSNESERFLLKDRDYDRQYAHIYASRLTQNRQILEEKAKLVWGDGTPIRKLSELVAEEKCAIIGTLFKQMVYKPNILKEMSEENQLEPQPIREKYTDSTDVVILEDEVQRIMLVGNVDTKKAITGTLVSVLGRQDLNSGKFLAEEIIYKDVKPTNESKGNPIEEAYVVLVSGLEVGGNDSNSVDLLTKIQLLVDLLNSTIGNEDINNKMAKVLRIIIAGNSLSSATVEKDVISHGGHHKHQDLQKEKEEKECRDAINKLDNFLFQLCINLDVDMMPGPYDPTTFTMPQKPLHPCLLQKSGTLSTLHLVPNPYNCKVHGVNFLGTSGQPIKEVVRITDYDTELEVLEQTLVCGHLAPVAPDTLGCYPYEGRDPFIIDTCPDVYFAGNCTKFDWKKLEDKNGKHKLIVTIPSFKATKTAVLVNLNNLTCSPITLT